MFINKEKSGKSSYKCHGLASQDHHAVLRNTNENNSNASLIRYVKEECIMEQEDTLPVESITEAGGKRIIRYEHYTVHLKIKPNEPRKEGCFYCFSCGKSFSTNSHLQRHMTVHSIKSQYNCKQCGRNCKRSDNLKKHLKTHEKQSERRKAYRLL